MYRASLICCSAQLGERRHSTILSRKFTVCISALDLSSASWINWPWTPQEKQRFVFFGKCRKTGRKLWSTLAGWIFIGFPSRIADMNWADRHLDWELRPACAVLELWTGLVPLLIFALGTEAYRIVPSTKIRLNTFQVHRRVMFRFSGTWCL